MTLSSPEESYRKGRRALAQRKPLQAAKYFREAISRERELGVMRPQMRYLSYFGLSMAMAHKPTHEALGCCERAAAEDGSDIELQLNLSRAYYLAGLPTRALGVIENGLRLYPGHGGLTSLRDKIDRRARPIVPVLSRDHPLNRSLGRLRSAIFPRRGASAGGRSVA